MEWLVTTNAHLTPDDLQRHIRIDTLANWCATITTAASDGERNSIRLFGEQFRVHREVIQGGLRFSLPGCANALQWTLTVDNPATRGTVIVHCTLNRMEVPAVRRSELEQFIQDWKTGLEAGATKLHSLRTHPVERPEAAPWFG